MIKAEVSINKADKTLPFCHINLEYTTSWPKTLPDYWHFQALS